MGSFNSAVKRNVYENTMATSATDADIKKKLNDRERAQRNTIQGWVEKANDPCYSRPDFLPDYITSKCDEAKKLLLALPKYWLNDKEYEAVHGSGKKPNVLAGMVYYDEGSRREVRLDEWAKEVVDSKDASRIVWMWAVIKGLYMGKFDMVFCPGLWEDEYVVRRIMEGYGK